MIKPMRFKVGVTFTGTHRKRVNSIVDALLKLGFSKDDIFYDEWHDVLINGIDADIELRNIYANHCDCVVVFLAKNYNTKSWTRGVEWRAIREIINTIKGKKICLLNVDGVDINDIDGLSSSTDIAKKIEVLSAEVVAEFIMKRYELVHDCYSTNDNDYDEAMKHVNSREINKGIDGLKIASTKGNLHSNLILSMIYREGIGGVTQDINQAKFYLDSARHLPNADPEIWANMGYKLYDENQPNLEPLAFLTAALECGYSIPGETCVGVVRIFYKLNYKDSAMRYAEYGTNKLSDEKCKRIYELLIEESKVAHPEPNL